MRRLLESLTAWTALGHPLALLALAVLLRKVGEQWWPTTAALYLPMWVWLLPSPVLVVAILLVRRPSLLWTQVAALLVVLFPLMGLKVARGGDPSDKPAIRLLTHNVFFGRVPAPELRAELEETRPDVVVMQATGHHSRDDLAAALPPSFHIHESTQFLLASRYPIVDVYLPPKLHAGTQDRSARFVRYTLATPLGLVDLYNVHPISPRQGLDRLRDDQDDAGIGLPSDDAIDSLAANTRLRRLQVEALAEHAQAARHPVLIAGDTNLPGPSWLFHEYLSDYQDGFAALGAGFGYTFPAHHPWMRIDRILAGPQLRFTSFELGPASGSDHRSLLATLVLQ